MLKLDRLSDGRRAATLTSFALLLLSGFSTLAADSNPAGGAGFELGKFLAPFHSVVLHYPIGFVTMAVILEVLAFFRTSAELRKIIVLVMGCAAATAVLSAASGIFRSGGGGYEEAALSSHKWYGISVTVLSVVGFALVFAVGRSPGVKSLLPTYRVLLAGNLVVLIIAGHLGGNLTHGKNYLFEGAPEFIKALMEEPAAAPAAVAGGEREKYYLDHIEPIFREKCYSCHGPEKQKGDYRLDQREVALKGGDSEEPGIVPGDPIASYLVHLILLPMDDDDVMPPSGKSPLTAEDMGRLISWIRDGAVFAPAAAGSH